MLSEQSSDHTARAAAILAGVGVSVTQRVEEWATTIWVAIDFPYSLEGEEVVVNHQYLDAEPGQPVGGVTLRYRHTEEYQDHLEAENSRIITEYEASNPR